MVFSPHAATPDCCAVDERVPLNNFWLFIAGSVHNPPTPYFYLRAACIQLVGSLRAYMPTDFVQREWAPKIRPCRSATRTTRHWNSSVWSQAACLKTPISPPNLRPWALRSWPHTPQRPGGWSGKGPRWENLTRKVVIDIFWEIFLVYYNEITSCPQQS